MSPDQNHISEIERENRELRWALARIKAQETPGANATVKRMAAIARKALRERSVS